MFWSFGVMAPLVSYVCHPVAKKRILNIHLCEDPNFIHKINIH